MQLEMLMFDHNGLRGSVLLQTTLTVWAVERRDVIFPLALTALDRVI